MCNGALQDWFILPRLGSSFSTAVLKFLWRGVRQSKLGLEHDVPGIPPLVHVLYTHLSRQLPPPPRRAGTRQLVCRALASDCRASHTFSVSSLSDDIEDVTVNKIV